MSADAMFRALAAPHRRRILSLVQNEPQSVSALAAKFEITQQAVSLHLKVLREAGLVAVRKDGSRHLYAVDPDGIESLQGYLSEFWPARLSQLKQLVETDDG